MSHDVKHVSEDSAPEAGRLSELVHDIRHCLHVLRMGRELVIMMDDPEQRRNVCESMAIEEKKAGELVDELVAIARGKSSRDQDA